MLPDKERPEWGRIITGDLMHNYSNYVLQVTVFKLQKDYKLKLKTKQQAIDKLYDICKKYYAITRKDINIIFKIN